MFMPPMLLEYAINNEPFDDDRYLAQLKLDGIRLLVSKMNNLRLYTKHTDATNRFPELHNPPIEKGTMLDGELIVTDEDGKPDFEACLNRFNSKKAKHHIQYCAFDILWYQGENVTRLPLEKRLELLDSAFVETEYYKKMRTIEGSAIKFFDIVKAAGLEGIVLKRKTSPYLTTGGGHSIRSWSWQKVLNYHFSEVVITGYSRDHKWLIGSREGTRIKPMGLLHLGVTGKHRKKVWPVLLQSKIGESGQFVFVDPLVRCLVKHRAFYKSGFMRLPVLEEVFI